MLHDIEKVKKIIADKKVMKFDNIVLDVAVNEALDSDTAYTFISEFISKLYTDLLAYGELSNYSTTFISFKLDKNSEDVYSLHPAAAYMNFVLFHAIIVLGGNVRECDLFRADTFTADTFKEYIDTSIVDRFKKIVSKENLSNAIEDIIYKYNEIAEDFSSFIGATIDLISDVELMLKDAEYDKFLHTEVNDNMTSTDIEALIKANSELIFEKILDTPNHCLKPMIEAGEGVNRKQFAEYQCAIGVKPDGKGGIFPKAISTSYIHGLDSVAAMYIDANGGRIAQNIQKNDVGDSGAMAKRTALLSSDMVLCKDPKHDCGSKNYISIYVADKRVLAMLDGRYYNKNGVDYNIRLSDKHLIGETINLRTPITCAGDHICYKCYGDLAHINFDIDIGNYGSRVFTERVTQTALSAKHVLASNSEDNEFSEGFEKMFKVTMSQISFNKDYPNIDKLKIVIRQDGIEVDDRGRYIVSFFNVEEKNKTYTLYPKGETTLFLGEHLSLAYQDCEGDEFSVSLSDFADSIEEVIFLTKIVNNDLTRTFTESHKLLETKNGVGNKTVSQLVGEQINILLKGNLPLPLIHIEVVIRNMVRSSIDPLFLPDWSIQNNSHYNIYTIPQALKLSSVTTSMSFQEVEDQFIKPATYRKTQSSSLDYLFVKRLGDR